MKEMKADFETGQFCDLVHCMPMQAVVPGATKEGSEGEEEDAKLRRKKGPLQQALLQNKGPQSHNPGCFRRN